MSTWTGSSVNGVYVAPSWRRQCHRVREAITDEMAWARRFSRRRKINVTPWAASFFR